MTHLVKPGHFGLPDALALITHKAADVLNLRAGRLRKGEAADLTLFDPEEEWTVTESVFHSKSKNSPYIGSSLVGRVKHTIVDGNLVTASLLNV